MKGLYFYKLVSPYSEDVTKDCKLTVNEIDHNFLTLKDADIRDFYIDNENGFLVLESNNGEKFKADISHFSKNICVEFDKEAGTIAIHHDGVVDVIDELITKSNISAEIETNIMTDETLNGNGGNTNPLGLTNVEKTSSYKAVIKVIDKTQGCNLPCGDRNKLGDRYLTYEEYNEHGYLYNYPSAQRFVQELHSDWRIPTKADWDNMLNALEVCSEDKNHDVSSCNNVLGKLAGKYLKSQDKWVKVNDCDNTMNSNCNCNCNCGCHDSDINNEGDDIFIEDECAPKPKPVTPYGVDSYGMRILPSGYGDGGMMMDYFGRRAKFWTSTEIQVTNMYVKRFDYDKSGVVQVADNPRSLASLRLVKDYDGGNFNAVETINGVNYKAVLMPSENTKHGFTIWLASNIAASQKKYCPVLPNNGELLSDKKVFFINEWNGFDWDKKELQEGDSLMIKFGPDSDKNAEYRLVNGELINIKKDIISTVENKYDDAVDDLKSRVDVIEDEIVDVKQSIANINDKIVELDAETKAREEVDKQLWEAVNAEYSARTEVDSQLWDAINNESKERNEVDAQLWEAVNTEYSARTEVDAQLWDATNNEAKERNEVDAQLWAALSAETVDRVNVDQEIWKSLNAEIERSVTTDEYINGRLISQSGSTYNCSDGVLTLVTDDPKNTIIIDFDSNYGTF